ncbi:hypothetical protein PsorP6_013040 [Peronosclerospora sorghi]|uniref:Uncharacterized protein n=1 Tax=Peronosclerospora sorghi TaxID=230839 RepID=A0ACC0WJY3_9STRA|nr:hypothetical protein PsorP6_013040 [Peronosclerospora sorghi]
MDSTVHMLRLDMLFRLFIGEIFVKGSEEMAQDKYKDEQAATGRVQAQGSTVVESATILEDGDDDYNDEDSYAVKGKTKEFTKDDDEDDIFTKGAGKPKSWDVDDSEDTRSGKSSPKDN